MQKGECMTTSNEKAFASTGHRLSSFVLIYISSFFPIHSLEVKQRKLFMREPYHPMVFMICDSGLIDGPPMLYGMQV